jgi:nucleoside-diphosphate-sugar epimerase
MRLVCDATKLRQRTGWEPRYTRRQGLEETIAWFLDPANLALYKPDIYNQ